MELFDIYKHKGLIQEKSDYTFTDKSLENFFYIGFIKGIFPNAKVINCKRNVLSSIMSMFQNNLIDTGWTHNLEYIFKSTLYNTVIPAHRCGRDHACRD